MSSTYIPINEDKELKGYKIQSGHKDSFDELDY
jgi:hypothetical protein